MDLNNTELDVEPDGKDSTATDLPMTTARKPIRPVHTVPLAAAVAPLRARHHEAVSSAARWSLEHGRPSALDVIALCIDVIEDHRTPDGVRLDRPGVHGVLYGQVTNRASILGTRLPEHWHIHLWSAINWLHDDGRLSPDSDPLTALLEPLGCYGGLGTDGYPMPPGVDVDFPCQCHVAHDPTCPPGLALHIVGHDPASYRDFIVRARLRLRGDDPTVSCLRPLFELSRPPSRLRKRRRPRRSRDRLDDVQFLLVHSPLVGPGTWNPVAAALRAAGHDVAVPDLRPATTTGRPDAVIAAAATATPTGWAPPVLVAHSGAGALLPSLADELAGSALVFVDAGVPPCAGATTASADFLDRLRGLAVDGVLPPWSTWWGSDVMTSLVPDGERRATLDAEMPSVPLAFYETSIGIPDGWCDAVPGAYLLLSEPYREDANRAQELGWPTVDRPGGHLDIVNHPEDIATLIVELAGLSRV